MRFAPKKEALTFLAFFIENNTKTIEIIGNVAGEKNRKAT